MQKSEAIYFLLNNLYEKIIVLTILKEKKIKIASIMKEKKLCLIFCDISNSKCCAWEFIYHTPHKLHKDPFNQVLDINYTKTLSIKFWTLLFRNKFNTIKAMLTKKNKIETLHYLTSLYIYLTQWLVHALI